MTGESHKCTQCGLVNFAAHDDCRRCGGALVRGPLIVEASPIPVERERGVGRKFLWICGMTLTLLFVCYMSLLATSERLHLAERQTVADAIAVLDRAGFSRDAFVLGKLVSYRSTDNWWNTYVGHLDAYAASNFPFEVVTLYSEFFEFPVDDTERAVILLHESYHLFGAGEETALRGVWLGKERLGWTAAAYSGTKVWKNTREWTAGSVPGLFECGPEGRSDCLE